MPPILQTLLNIVKYIFFALIAGYFLFEGVRGAIDRIKEYLLFRKVKGLDRQGAVTIFLNRLAELPPDTLPQILSHILLPIDDHLYLEKIVREHTQFLQEKVKVGIHNKPRGKVKTQYYIDLINACSDATTRKNLARMLAIKITEITRNSNYTFDTIAVSALGNVLLAAEVGDLLDKPILLFGDLAGVTFPEGITNKTPKANRYIIVDGLASTGAEAIHLSKLIHEKAGEVKYAFMLIDRCFGARDRLRQESPAKNQIELICLGQYDDKQLSQLFNS